MTFIPEGDVYRLIVHSRLPGAERFEKWVFDEVLPMIRKTGGYMTASLLEQAAEKPEILLAFADQLLAEHEKTGSSPARWNGCGRKQIFMTPLSMKKTAPISEPRRKNCKSGERAFCRFLMDAGFCTAARPDTFCPMPSPPITDYSV